MKTKKILIFLLLTFAISWISALLIYLAGIPYGSGLSVLFTATFYMMAPAIAAIITQKLWSEPIKSLGLDLKQTRWKQMLWLPLINIAICILTAIVIWLFGSVFGIQVFGRFDMSDAALTNRLSDMLVATGRPAISVQLPAVPVFILMLAAGSIIGGVVNSIATFGEELGWRGLLYNEFRRLGFFRSTVLTGIIWGLWHAPIILQGHNYPEHRIAGVFMMMVFCIPLAMLMTYVRTRTRSVLGPTILHGMVNGTAGAVMFFCYQYNDLIGNVAGLAGAAGCSLALVFLYIVDKKTFAAYAELRDLPAEESTSLS